MASGGRALDPSLHARDLKSAMTQLTDPFARPITYLRVSVTDRCDLRCVYCMAEDMTFLPRTEILSLEELDHLCGAFVEAGVRRLRITGGEPLVRRNVLSLFRSLGKRLGDGLDELTLTTNGTQLTRHAEALAEAGVKRINVSLDTLDPARFARLTRWGRIEQVFAGIAAAQAAGLVVKINAVALRGENEDEFDDMIAWCGRRGLDLCLIETMPMGEIGQSRADQYLPLSLVRSRLHRRWTLDETAYRTGGPARYVTIRETGRRLGFITPMTHNFCEDCNRVRLTVTGTLYMCLGQDDAADLRAPLRRGENIDAAIRAAIARKPKGHDFVIDRRLPSPSVNRHMSVTGG
jgi:cyclic pyranopterin phosphate synthase